MTVTEFTNFGKDSKGDFARCTQCYQKYYDWDAAKNIAFCPKCRKANEKA